MMDDLANETLTVMRSHLAAFTPSSDVRSLDRLVAWLSAAIDALTGHADDDWINELRGAWWPLEYINANALGDDRLQLKASEVDAVSTARDEFLGLLEEY
jgi:hypothetical protein